MFPGIGLRSTGACFPEVEVLETRIESIENAEYNFQVLDYQTSLALEMIMLVVHRKIQNAEWDF